VQEQPPQREQQLEGMLQAQGQQQEQQQVG